MSLSTLTYAATAVLQSIALGYRHGFDVSRASGLPSGTVYPALRRLEAARFVTSAWEDHAVAQRAQRPPRKSCGSRPAVNRLWQRRSRDIGCSIGEAAAGSGARRRHEVVVAPASAMAPVAGARPGSLRPQEPSSGLGAGVGSGTRIPRGRAPRVGCVPAPCVMAGLPGQHRCRVGRAGSPGSSLGGRDGSGHPVRAPPGTSISVAVGHGDRVAGDRYRRDDRRLRHHQRGSPQGAAVSCGRPAPHDYSRRQPLPLAIRLP